MLQQTQVATAIPHYLAWMKKFPDIRSLAQASEGHVLRQWAGLGYYARARNAHKAAKSIAKSGRFPISSLEWLELPGIGEYTAGAISSLAYGMPDPILDGNIIRVLSRFFGLNFLPQGGVESRKAYWILAGMWAKGKHPGEANEGLMELGALICTPGKPHCADCPVALQCVTRKQGWQGLLPPIRVRPKPEEVRGIAVVNRCRGSVLLEERQKGEFLAGHLMFPILWKVKTPKSSERIATVRHSIMNRRYTFEIQLADGTSRTTEKKFKWVSEKELPGLLTNSLARKIWSAVQNSRP